MKKHGILWLLCGIAIPLVMAAAPTLIDNIKLGGDADAGGHSWTNAADFVTTSGVSFSTIMATKLDSTSGVTRYEMGQPLGIATLDEDGDVAQAVFYAIQAGTATTIGDVDAQTIEALLDLFGTTESELGVALGVAASATNSGTSVGYGSLADDFGVSVGNGADGRRRGVAVGLEAMGVDDGAAIGHRAIAHDQGSAMGYLASAPRWGAAVGIESEGNDGGAAIGAVTVARDNNTAAGSFSSSFGLSSLLGGNSFSSERSVVAGFNAAAVNRSVAIGHNAHAIGSSNVVVGAGAHAGTLGDGWGTYTWNEMRVNSDWGNFRQSIMVSNAPAGFTNYNGTYLLDAHGGDMVWATFKQVGSTRVIKFLHNRVAFYSSEDADTDTDKVLWTDEFYGTWGNVLATIHDAEFTTWNKAGGGTTMEMVVDIGEVSEELGVGCGAIGVGAKAVGNNAWAIGTGAINTTDNTTFISGNAIVTTNDVVALRFKFSDGAFLYSRGGTNLMFVTSGGTTNKVTLTTP